MALCKDPNCQYPACNDPQVSVDFCCEKCEGRFNGEDWANGGKKKHTACCTSTNPQAVAKAFARGFESQPSFIPAGFISQPEEKRRCGHPECEYTVNSDPSISADYCCQKCEGMDKGEPWAVGGKRHYKDCQKCVFRVRFGEDWAPSSIEEREPRERAPLERHSGAERDTRPAWMTKGVGINTEIFGETKGDLVKPGLTKADVERIEERLKQRGDSPDPLADFMNSSPADGEADRPRSRSRTPPKRAPLPDQREQYLSG